jgi:hypothetical protein
MAHCMGCPLVRTLYFSRHLWAFGSNRLILGFISRENFDGSDLTCFLCPLLLGRSARSSDHPSDRGRVPDKLEKRLSQTSGSLARRTPESRLLSVPISCSDSHYPKGPTLGCSIVFCNIICAITLFVTLPLCNCQLCKIWAQLKSPGFVPTRRPALS